MRRVHHLVGNEVDVESLPVAEGSSPHAAVGYEQLFEAAVLLHQVAGGIAAGIASGRVGGLQSIHAQLQGAARNHAVLEGHVAFGLDVVATGAKVVDSPLCRIQMPGIALIPQRFVGQLLFGIGQLEHRLGRIDNRRVVSALRAIGSVGALYPVGTEVVGYVSRFLQIGA